MRKILIAMGLIVLLAAPNAQAAYSLGGYAYPDAISASIEVSVNGNNLGIRVQNTSSIKSYLTSLLFEVPDGLTLSFAGAFDKDDNPIIAHNGSGNKSYVWGYTYDVNGNLPNLGNGAAYTDYVGTVNGLLYTKNGFRGGRTAIGIAQNEWAMFNFTFTGDIGDLDPFVARFQGIPTGSGSDVATPTPIPGAAWLLGSGLVGLVGLRRRFH